MRMGIIYNTTMKPSKNELVEDRLVRQDFFTGKKKPQLIHVGGSGWKTLPGRSASNSVFMRITPI